MGRKSRAGALVALSTDSALGKQEQALAAANQWP
jgi:hypothetical protein